ncbi:prolyl-tRNA synthetase associated domain-containing protein [Consotaella salsifontis]|uniref:Ala-tRNA(Pro) hydrolase n=1 Tax=Consotaella salsifontis TaxID=1365950 RepID=A0A1T4SD53_9HYPH|nr:prolyl-tRNA synthetase associated domain-containing protein [Consotaella salsifontis]SKA25808.1 Ala-tRNA(Pro) hydrolase [Consotaella salsifontis]
MKRREDLFAFLEGLGIETTTIDHRPVFTVAEGDDVREGTRGGHTKNLFLKDKKSRIFLVVAEQTREVDLKTLHRRIGGSGRLSFADSERMMALLGVEPGSVTAFGVINDIEHVVAVVLDQGLLLHDMVNCHPLTNRATTTIATSDLLAFFRATGHEPLITSLDGEASSETKQEAP